MKGYKYAHSYYTSLQCWWPLARGCCPLANKAENIDLKLVWAGGMQTYTHLMGNLGPQLKHGSFTAPRNASQMATGSAMSSTRRLSDTHTHTDHGISMTTVHILLYATHSNAA